MTSFVAVVMLLAFLMGLGSVPSSSISKKCGEDPWGNIRNSAKVSQDKCGADPWGHLTKCQASQKKYQATAWDESIP